MLHIQSDLRLVIKQDEMDILLMAIEDLEKQFQGSIDLP